MCELCSGVIWMTMRVSVCVCICKLMCWFLGIPVCVIMNVFVYLSVFLDECVNVSVGICVC